jgi:hypothetical protein
MQSDRAINAFLEAMSVDKDKAGRKPWGTSFITISRQFGAGGHELADAILDEMKLYPNIRLLQGWKIFDKEICQIVAENPKLRVSLNSLLDESYLSRSAAFLAEILIGHPPQDAVYKKIIEVIHSLASIGKVILIGRGGACITAGWSKGVRLRLVASEVTRLKWAIDQRLIEAKSAEKTLRERDRARKRLVSDCFGKDIDDPLLYDAIWNMDAVPVHEIAKSAVRLIMSRAGLEPN